ncbi:MAG: hypothetical protein IPI52_00580 [Bacteroidetes bacterium]|nr:hypothetical protein [Bacteroidota bacterium]
MIILKAANIQFFRRETFNFMMMNRCMVLKVDLYLEKLKAMTAAFNVPKTLNIYVTKITANEDGTYL